MQQQRHSARLRQRKVFLHHHVSSLHVLPRAIAAHQMRSATACGFSSLVFLLNIDRREMIKPVPQCCLGDDDNNNDSFVKEEALLG